MSLSKTKPYTLTPKPLLKIGEASKALGIHIDTLRRWEKSGKITSIRTPGGTRLYSLEQLQKFNPLASQGQALQSYKPSSLSTEELLASSSLRDPEGAWQSPTQIASSSFDNLRTPRNDVIKKSFFSIQTFSLLTGIILTLTGGFLTLSNLMSSKDDTAKVIGVSSNVLAALSGPKFLEVNSDTQINGALDVTGTINNLILEGTPSGTITIASGDTTFTISEDSNLDQDVSSASSPTFNSLNLSATTNQIVFQSGGPTGTLTWTPTGTAKIVTIPNATGEVSLLGQTISNGELDNSSLTVSAGTNLSGGGSVALGGSVTLNLKDSISLSGTLGVTGATTLSSATLSSTLAVTGASTLTGNVTASGNLTVAGVTSLTGNVGIGYTGTTPTFPSLGLAVQGNVGINTTSPNYNLDVNGSARVRDFTIDGSCTGCGGLSGGTAGQVTFWSGATSVSGNTDFFWNNTSGRLGIGTSAPTQVLHVVGNGFFTGDIDVNGGDLDSTASTFNLSTTPTTLNLAGGSSSTGCTIDSSGNLTCAGNLGGGSTGTAGFWTRNGTTLVPSTSSDTVATYGNVGVGTTNPTSKLQVEGSVALNLGSDATGDLFYRNSGGTISRLAIGSSGQTMAISLGVPIWSDINTFTISSAAGWVDAGAYVRLLTMGDNVGIGTTVGQDPIGKLHIRGNDDTTALSFVTTNNANSVFGLSVLNNGNVGIGTTLPTYQLQTTGNVGIGDRKSVSNPTTLNGLTLNLGSDATGDIFYRSSSGYLSRLPIGSTDQILQVSSGIPSWANSSGLSAAAGWTDDGTIVRLTTSTDNVGIGTSL